MSFRSDAIHSLVPDANFTLSNNEIFIWDSDKEQPSEEEIQTKIAELRNAEPMRLLREERNRKLQETDWRFRSDLSPSQEWIDYSQALRDLPSTASPKIEKGILTNVTWPTKPE